MKKSRSTPREVLRYLYQLTVLTALVYAMDSRSAENRPRAGGKTGWKQRLVRLPTDVRLAVLLVALPWLVYLLDWLIDTDLRRFGIRPGRLDGLPGIIASPFIHGEFSHLLANSGALLVLLVLSLSFSRRLTAAALLIITWFGGSLVWCFAPPGSIHIGASGTIYGLISYLICIGVFRRERAALIISLAVFLFYEGMLTALFIAAPGVSVAGHAFGLLAGLLAGLWVGARGVPARWTSD